MTLGFDGQYEGTAAIIALFLVFIYLAILLSAPAYISTVIGSFAAKRRYRNKRLAINSVITEFKPPKNISPAELGYLFDSHLKHPEIIATILDLKQRGLLTKGINKKLVRTESGTKAQESLKPHEVVVLNAIDGKKSIKKVAKKSFKKFTPALKSSLVDAGLIEPRKATANYKARRTIKVYFVLSALVFLWLIKFGTMSFTQTVLFFIIISTFLFPALIGLAILIGRTYDNIVGQPSIWTDNLKNIWPKVEGFKNYVEKVELERIKYESETNETLSTNKTMPYAVALGMNTGWKKQFKK
jgi:hypothetical protein